MTDLFVPPPKTRPTPEPVAPAEPPDPDEVSDEVPDDTTAASAAIEPPSVEVPGEAAPIAGSDAAAIAEPTPEVAPTSAEVSPATGLGEPALAALAPDTVPQVPDATLATVDSLFFYGRTGSGDPTLYEVDLANGTLAPVAGSPDLFPTALGGLFAAESLVPLGSGQPADRVYTLVQGGNGKNFLIGTAADDALLGLGGDDLILTGSGYNLAFGGLGNDTLVGGVGDDGLFGGAGNDTLEGGAGDDLLMGGPGNDVLDGGAGANVLVGGSGADTFRLNTPGAYSTTIGTTAPDILVDFNAAQGDLLDFSLIAAQPLFAGSDLLPSLKFVQVGADTHVQVGTTTEAILLGVEADTITPASITLTPPVGLPVLK